ncbi:MAG: 5-deoxy-glucuronate isomerase, partial [Spirochaetota bacterium]
CDVQRETAILLVEGQLRLSWENTPSHARSTQEILRPNCFDHAPSCLHVSLNTEVLLEAMDACEVVLQQATNGAKFSPQFYRPEDLKVQVFGEGEWCGTAVRSVCTIFDRDIAPYSQMVMGEVINHPGRWSSYPPHSHRQPEIYYYRFNYPQGFGSIHIGEEAYAIRDRSAALITGGLDHPQTSAPGYAMYFCWMIRHLPGDPWRERQMNPDHNWLNRKGVAVWPDKP